MTPIIFLTFANDPDAHLALLKEESRRLYGALEELDRKEYLKLIREESARVDDIFATFNKNKDRVAIFHYAGHAEGTQLHLEAGSGNADGLAQLMGQQENLQLVFLNGCSSKGQVQGLLEAGVPAVIATSVPIEDRKATEFAQQFYEALANRRTIGQAFAIAQAYLRTRYSQSVDVSLRDASWAAAVDAAPTDPMPWGLYLRESERERILNWKLPYFRPVGLPQDMIQYIGKSFTANRYIVLALDEMCKYNPDIYAQMVEKRGEEVVKKDSKEYPWLVIGNFPWPIGSQVRLLKFYDEPNVERLEHLVSTYLNTGQLLYYILLSDLWEQARHATEKTRWDGLGLTKEAYAAFDFLAPIPDLYDQVAAGGIPFVGEFEILSATLRDPESQLSKAHGFLEELRKKLQDNPPTADLDKLCLKTEQAVSIVLRAAAFLARYRLLTVRNVSIDKPRFEPVAYELDMGP
ncbi:MAG: CHAT domain-containing protein, partial [Lewinella sp.]|nr:CHAT domain-containing protein [Lewinella sp.]